MLKIVKGENSGIEIDADTTGIEVYMTDYSGSFDRPENCAMLYLTHDEAKQVRDYLNEVYPSNLNAQCSTVSGHRPRGTANRLGFKSPSYCIQWARLDENNPLIGSERDRLSHLNDYVYDFLKIADLIEKEL